MNDEEAKRRAALECELNSRLRAIQGGGPSGRDQIGGALSARGNPHLEYAEAQGRINADAQAQFLALCKELLPLGATQVNCGIFQVTFREVAR